MDSDILAIAQLVERPIVVERYLISILFINLNNNNIRMVPRSNRGGETKDIMAEWLRRWTANPLGSARAGSNPADVAFISHGPVVRIRVFHTRGQGSIPCERERSS